RHDRHRRHRQHRRAPPDRRRTGHRAGRRIDRVITGDPGVGKSRLLGELRRLVQADPGLRWAEAHATSYGPNQSYRMYASTLRELFGTEGLPPDEEIERTRARLDELGASDALPFVCHLLDLPLDPSMRSGFSELSRSEVQRRAYRAMRRLYLALGEEKPYVLAVDDLQWADPAVVDFLEGAPAVVDWAPILLCFVFRPDPDAPVWPLKERAARELPDAYTEIKLGPLTGDESRQLLRELLGADPGAEATLGDQAEAILLGRVEGNPLFAQEVVSALLDRGALIRKDGQWTLNPAAAGRVPETLQATILARIDRLPEEARQVVQTGAVLGRSFSHQLLVHLAGEGPALTRGLREALRAGLLRERGGSSERGYTFSQRLVQEVAERTLLVRRRKELHAATVGAIEALYPNRLAAHANALARHAYQAESWPAAMEYARVAADRSAANLANRDAYRLYIVGLRAAEHLGPDAPGPAVVQLLAGKAELLSRFGQVEQAAAALAEALERASRPDFVGDEQTDPARVRARLALDLAWARIATFEVDAVERALDVAVANIQDGAPELATVWTIRSWALLHRGDLTGAARAAREALRIALEVGGFEERAQAYGALIKPGLAGEIGPSIKTYAEEAVRLAREHQHDGHLFDALIGLEVLRLICLQPYEDEALQNALEAAELAGKMHARPAESAARVVLGATYISAGRWDEAEEQLAAGGTGHASLPIVEALRALMLGGLWTARGRLAEARELLESGLQADNFTHTGVWFNLALATNRHLAGEPESARAALASAEAEAARLGCLVCEASLCARGSELLAELGDARAAELAARAEIAGDGA
nr:AAA family ATPase [Chloroflexota bacterium]